MTPSRARWFILLLTQAVLAFCADTANAAGNDNFANPELLPGYSGTVTGDNINATIEPMEPSHGGNVGGASVWYRWTAPYTNTAIISTIGSDFDTVLAVYTGNNVVNLIEIASNNNVSSVPGPSLVTFNAVAGTVYQIAVDGINPDTGAATGAITLNYKQDAPEIAVEQPPGTDIPDNGAKAFGNVLIGSNASLTFTIRNTGTVDLTGLGIGIDGANASDFAVIANPAAPVVPSGSTTFTVQFSPVSVGTKTAAIHIASNDANESPFDIILTGNGIAPEIAVDQPLGSNIPDNGSRGFGKVLIGSSNSLTFTIKNTGTSDLTGLGIGIDGANASDFAVTTNPTAPVVPSGSTTFTVQFSPVSLGTKTAAIHIASNDTNESPFDIILTGNGVAPEIAVDQPLGSNIPDNGSRGFGKVLVGSGNSLTFTIKNTGTANLTGLGIGIGGADASDFAVTTNPTAPVVSGSVTTFTVRFKPSSLGAKTAAIHIASNDANESPFDIILTGTGIAPEIAVNHTTGLQYPG